MRVKQLVSSLFSGFLFGSCLCISGFTHANQQQQDMCNGLYFGVGAGESLSQSKITLNTSNTLIVAGQTTATVVKNRSFRFGQDNLMATTYLGYSKAICCSRWLFGAEFFANFSNQKLAINDNYFISTLQIFSNRTTFEDNIRFKKVEFGLDILPKYNFFNDFCILGRIGLSVKQLKLTNKTINDHVSLMPTVTQQSNVNLLSVRKKTPGLRLGIGLEKYLCSNFSIDINYIYTVYRHLEMQNIADTVTPNGTVPQGFSKNIKTSFRNQNILLRINYYLY